MSDHNNFTLPISRIVIVNGMGEDDSGVVYRTYETASDAFGLRPDIDVQIESVRTKEDLCTLIARLQNTVREKGVPLLQLEFHGGSTSGLKFQSDEYLHWGELRDQIRCLNQETKNYLVLVTNICHSLQLLEYPRFDRPSPFYCLVAPPQKIDNSEIERSMNVFYTLLVKQGLKEALQSIRNSYFEYFPEEILKDVIREQLEKYEGRRGQKYREECLTNLLEKLPQADDSPDVVSSARRAVKNTKKNFSRERFVSMTNMFLCGRDPVLFNYEDLFTPYNKPEWVKTLEAAEDASE